MGLPDLILLGYWPGRGGDPWPSPDDYVDPTWDDDVRETVADYLRRGFVSRAYMGYSPCRLCGENNGALELSDGVYVWPEGQAHYVENHLCGYRMCS